MCLVLIWDCVEIFLVSVGMKNKMGMSSGDCVIMMCEVFCRKRLI